MTSQPSPWLTLAQAAAYVHRGRRFLRCEVKKGRLRAALVGGRREILTRREWLDDYLEAQAAPIDFHSRRRA